MKIKKLHIIKGWSDFANIPNIIHSASYSATDLGDLPADQIESTMAANNISWSAETIDPPKSIITLDTKGAKFALYKDQQIRASVDGKFTRVAGDYDTTWTVAESEYLLALILANGFVRDVAGFLTIA